MEKLSDGVLCEIINWKSREIKKIEDAYNQKFKENFLIICAEIKKQILDKKDIAVPDIGYDNAKKIADILSEEMAIKVCSGNLMDGTHIWICKDDSFGFSKEELAEMDAHDKIFG